MSNIMNLKRITNKPSRNGFDLSTKRNFTAKVGELLPVLCQEVIPGDKVVIDLKAMSRTQPLNTAAFARIREYYDFFFVPFNQLWNRSNTVLSKMDYNQTHADSLSPNNAVYNGELPYTTLGDTLTYLNTLRANEDVNKNFFNYNRATLTSKLLEYLGIHRFPHNDTTVPLPPSYSIDVDYTIFPLLAYQKIYADFYRDEQWEKAVPSCFNVDYMNGSTSMKVAIPTSSTDDFYTNYNMFDLRYCNWQKDLLHGVIPSPQYGAGAVVPIDVTLNSATLAPIRIPTNLVSGDSTVTDTDGSTVHVPSSLSAWSSINTSDSLQAKINSVSGNLSVLALRQYEFLQKWKEIAGSGDQNYKDMTKRIWNVDVSEHLAERVRYLGGLNTSIDINEVVNTNITSDYSADIAGKGVGISNGKVEFNSDGQFGYIMCIYHAMPLVDYTITYTNPSFLRVNAEDYANPVFDKVGMQSVNAIPYLNDASNFSVLSSQFNLGYAPRYIDYKTNIDLSMGGFVHGGLDSWIVGCGVRYLMQGINRGSTGIPEEQTGVPQPNMKTYLNYSWFKVKPNLLDSIMAVSADSTVATDQLLCTSFFDIKAVRNLDVNGLPY